MKTLLTFMITAFLAVRCVFAATWYVSTTGSDSNGGNSAAAPLKTIAKAISKAAAGSATTYTKICIEGGVYSENITCAKNYLLFEGSYVAGFGSRNLKNSRTIILSPTTAGKCFYATGTFNTLSGIDFVGGTYGFQSSNTAKTSTSKSTRAANHHLLYQCVFSNNTYAVHDNGNYFESACLSCLFVGNARGICVTGARDKNTSNVYCYNCTFANNTECAIYYKSQNTSVFCEPRNCIFTGNGVAIQMEMTAASECTLYSNLFWNNGEDFNSTYAWTVEKPVENGTGFFRHNASSVFLDPKLTTSYELGSGSFAAKMGENLASMDNDLSVAADLYGNSWGGQYDFGCVKTSEASPIGPAFSHVYVSPDGDDSNLALSSDAAHPIKTLALALLKVAANGTVHLSKGTYTGSSALSANGVLIVGESRDEVIVREQTALPSNTHQGYAIGLFGADTTVSNITFTTSTAGLFPVDAKNLNHNPKVENCVFKNNRHGIIEGNLCVRAGSTSTYFLSVTHSQFLNNTGHGIAFFSSGSRVSNCLFANNGYDGVNGDVRSTCPHPVIYQCTFIGNGSYGYRETYETASSKTESYVVNSLFYNNGRTLGSGAGVIGGDKVTVDTCCFFSNANAVKGSDSSGTPVSNNLIEADPKLDLSDARYGRLNEGSPCAKAGTDYVNDYFTYCTDDLAYDTRPSTTALDIGCYISPETMEDLIGHGYSYLTIVGVPGEYGEPNIAYGKTLYKDGTVVSLSISSGMVTYDGGARGYPVSDTKRVAYKGYALKRDSQPFPERESETEETLANVIIAESMTWTLKWEPQYVVSASHDVPDCSVTLGDKETPPCTGERVAVTNWIAEGSSYLIRFNSSSDYQFSNWAGEFPPEGDARVNEQTIVCHGSYSFYPTYKSIICVSQTNGHDEYPGTGTAAHPFKTIVKGVSRAGPGDIVRIAVGTYNESVTNTAVNELTIEGGYTDEWVRDLKLAQTVIEPPQVTLPCIYLNGVVSNVVRGLVLQKGSFGIVAQGPDKVSPSTTFAFRNNRLEQLIVRQNVSHGIQSSKNSDAGVRVVSSLVYENGGNGINLGGDNGAPFYVHNCTIVRNTGNGIAQGYGYNALEIRNTLAVDNGQLQVSLHPGPNGPIDLLSGYNCFYNSESPTNALTVTVRNYLLAGNYFFDPAMNDDFTLAAASPCIGLGENLTDYPLNVELEDLYGTPWAGRYDIGAIRAEAEPAAFLPEVTVAPGEDLQSAILRCAVSGTVHVAAGDYAGPVTIPRRGVRVVSDEGQKKTRIVGGGFAANDMRGDYAVQLAADDAELCGFTITGADNGCGVLFGISHFAKNALVSECTVTGNKYGVGYNGLEATRLANMVKYAFDGDAGDSATWARHRMTHCRVVDNFSHGIYAGWLTSGYLGMIADNCLVARNGGSGVQMVERSGSGKHVKDYFYYCTVADNVEYGFYETGNDSVSFQVFNSIVSGNATGVCRSTYDDPRFENTVIGGNAVDFAAGQTFGQIVNCPSDAPVFTSRTGVNAYCPTKESPAYGLARELTAADLIDEPTDDLAHNVRSGALHRDAGCRALPPYGAVAIFF